MTFKIDTDAPPSKCKGCGADIWWFHNVVTGRDMPCDRDGTSHFATCPKAAQFRKEKKV